MLKNKHVDEVLKRCITLAGKDGSFQMPAMFAGDFPKIQESDVYEIMSYLHKDKYIVLSNGFMQPEDESLSQYSILVNAKAYTHFLESDKKQSAFRRERKWNLATALITALASALLGAGLARLSLLIWPQ